MENGIETSERTQYLWPFCLWEVNAMCEQTNSQTKRVPKQSHANLFFLSKRLLFTLMRPISFPSFKSFHAHSFQFLKDITLGATLSPDCPFSLEEHCTPGSPLAPGVPLGPGGPWGPVFPGLPRSPLTPSRPSRPSRPGDPGDPGLPCIPGIPA